MTRRGSAKSQRVERAKEGEKESLKARITTVIKKAERERVAVCGVWCGCGGVQGVPSMQVV